MSKIILPLNTAHTINVNNGTTRSFTFNIDGTLSVPNNISLGNTTNAFKAIINAGNIVTSDKTFTLLARGGNLALEDNTSLNVMLPSQTGNTGLFLKSDGTNTSWLAVLNSLGGQSTSTYPAQTFGTIGTTGTAPAWTSALGVHTLNVPMASAAGVTAGLVSKTDYDRVAFKDLNNTFTSPQTFNSTGSTFANAPFVTTTSTAPNAVATYAQVLAARNGIGIRPPVDALDTTSLTLATANPVIDGYTIQIGDRVLATNLTTGKDKVYKATGTLASVTWVLEVDGQAQDGTATDGDILFIQNGSGVGNHSDQQWAYNGTAWVLYNTSAAYTFSTGLTVTGNTITVTYGSTAGTAIEGNDPKNYNDRYPLTHQFDNNTLHTITGKTAGQVLIANSATTYGFTTFSQDIGSVSAAGAVTIAKINNVVINDLGVQQNSSTLADNTAVATLVTGCAWAVTTYRTVRIQYSISRGVGNYASGYVVLLHDGTTPRITYVEDDSVGFTTATIPTFSTDINSGNIRLLYVTNSTGTAATMKFTVQAFPI